ncbi:hypothetical protein BpHYR1_015334, partial [Brachionus plicatilis]
SELTFFTLRIVNSILFKKPKYYKASLTITESIFTSFSVLKHSIAPNCVVLMWIFLILTIQMHLINLLICWENSAFVFFALKKI